MAEPIVIARNAQVSSYRGQNQDKADENGPDVNILIGPNLKRLRNDRGLSLDGLARLAGVSRAMLSQIERGSSAPTINVVWKLARAFDVPFSILIAGADTQLVRPLPASETQTLVSATGGLASRALFPMDAAQKAEFYEIRLKAGSVEDASPHPDGTVENLVVSSGGIEIDVGGKRYKLETGDAILFPGDQAHVYRNPNDQEAVIFLVMTYP